MINAARRIDMLKSNAHKYRISKRNSRTVKKFFFCKFVYTKGITGKEQALRDVILPIPVFDVCKRLSLSIQYDSS